jgi:hypothetical protein
MVVLGILIGTSAVATVLTQAKDESLPGCSAKNVREMRSPSGSLAAVNYQLECAGKISDEVDIQPTPTRISAKHGNALSVPGTSKVEFVWADESHLEVRRKREPGTWKESVQVQIGWFSRADVKVEYRD